MTEPRPAKKAKRSPARQPLGLVKLDRGPASRLLPALEEAFACSERYVAENLARAKAARADGKDWLARDLYEATAADLAPAIDGTFQRAAQRLVSLVADALMSGNTGHVLFLAAEQNGALNERRKIKWAEVCQQHLLFLRKDFGMPELAKEMRANAIEELPFFLSFVDAKASALTSKDVAKVLGGKASSVSGIAAKLACACGAVGYSAADFSKAKDRFKKALSEG